MAKKATKSEARKRKQGNRPASEVVRRQLARTAIEQQQAGKTPSARELQALERYEREQDEQNRARLFAAVPKGEYCRMAGRQQKVVDGQARALGLPLDRPVINFYDVIPAFHDLLAKNWRKFRDLPSSTAGPAVGESPNLERLRAASADLRELELEEKRRTLVPREDVRRSLQLIAESIRQAGETLKRQFGNDALDSLNEALHQARSQVQRHSGGKRNKSARG